MILYIAKSGSKIKVGITSNLRQRFAQYCTHNPDIELTEKVGGLAERSAQKLEKLVHDILGVSDDEWTPWSEQQVDEAIEIAKRFMEGVSALHRKWGQPS